MKPAAFFGKVVPGELVDGEWTDVYIPGKSIRAIVFDRFTPECTVPAENQTDNNEAA